VEPMPERGQIPYSITLSLCVFCGMDLAGREAAANVLRAALMIFNTGANPVMPLQPSPVHALAHPPTLKHTPPIPNLRCVSDAGYNKRIHIYGDDLVRERIKFSAKIPTGFEPIAHLN
jgi:hypothetical protein